MYVGTMREIGLLRGSNCNIPYSAHSGVFRFGNNYRFVDKKHKYRTVNLVD
jgi:hypothetical protein